VRATFEEGTEIQVDSENPAYAAGWADTAATGSDVFRLGSKVTLALRVKNAAKAAALITTLPQDFRPQSAVIDKSKKVEVKANGEVLALDGSGPLEAAENRVYEITYRAGAVSP
jgi:hypothetical protein